MIRVTIELHEVTVAGVKYMSNYPQHEIDSADPFWCKDTKKWEPIECMNDLHEATRDSHGTPAEGYVFVRCPTAENPKPLWERIQERVGFGRIEEVRSIPF